MGEKVSLQAAADMLGVSRRRAQFLVDSDVLQGELIGNTRLIDVDDIRYLERVRRQSAGAPITAGAAWTTIQKMDPHVGFAELDDQRRRVQPRADHQPLHVHPSIIRRLRDDGSHTFVFGGSDAAVNHDVPVGGPDALLHVYIRDRDIDEFARQTQPEQVTHSAANLILHAVPAGDWPFHGEQHAALNVAWIDMADHDERGAEMVLAEWRRR